MKLVAKKESKKCSTCGVVLVVGETQTKKQRECGRLMCSKCHSAKSMKWYNANKGKRAKYKRSKDLLDNYGITTDDYDRMLAKQKNRCGICGKHTSELNRQFAVDHDHSYTMPNPEGVRGLLCNLCNSGMGGLRDNIELLEAAITWLENYESSKES